MIVSKALIMSNQCRATLQATDTSAIEVMGVLGTDFLSLDELAPGQDWDDLLAAQWGIPAAVTTTPNAKLPAIVKQGVNSLWENCFGWAFAA